MKIGFCSALALLFIGLKLGNVITWSWWLVLLPLYFGAALFVGSIMVVAVLAVLAGGEK